MFRKTFFLMVLLLVNVIDLKAQPTWLANINLQAGSSNINLAFGGSEIATSGFDIGLDVPAAPPPPSSYYAFFQISGSIVSNLNQDIRNWVSPFINNIDWTLVVTNAVGLESTISWDPAELPGQGAFFLEGASNINMRDNNSTTFTGNRNRYSPTLAQMPAAFFSGRGT